MSVSRSNQAICLCNLCFLSFIIFFPHFSHPLSFSINQFNAATKGVVYQGDAWPSSEVIELNRITYKYRVGRAMYAEPLHLWDSTTESLADFSTHFTFMVDTGNSEVFSDGVAFFLSPVGYQFPPDFSVGGLGLFNTHASTRNASQSQVVSMEFDTWSNNEWDPPGPHIGINIKDVSSVVYADWNVSIISGKLGNAWITYNATANNLTVFWTFTEKFNPAFLGNASSITYHVDLRKVLPEWVTIGFSASSGEFSERHVISSWEFNSTLVDNDIRRGKIKQKKKKKTFLILVTAIPGFTMMLGVIVCWLVVSRKSRNNNSQDVSTVNTDLERVTLPKRFGYKELVAATDNFASDRRLGQGGSGQVYKGLLQDLGGCTVAVKRIFAESNQQYEKVFINEVRIISRVIHRNLVKFIGWCHEQGECLLVYAYMPNTSLDTHLFGPRTTLQWDNRYKIALGLVSALHYLHEEAEQCVLHRDIKSANVMLDNDFNTKLGDFGIAKLMDPRFRTQTRGVVGTFGYMAPEYANEGRASKESDMFSFGVVALEIACGRKTYQHGEYHLPLFSWVCQLHLAGNLLDAADERLEMNYNENEMKCLLIVGLWCTYHNNKKRPKAGQVMKVLQLEAPLPELPRDMHDHSVQPEHQLQTQAASSQVSLTSSSLVTVGR